MNKDSARNSEKNRNRETMNKDSSRNSKKTRQAQATS